MVGGGKVNRIENRGEESSDEIEKQMSSARVEEKVSRKKSERFTYLIAAMIWLWEWMNFHRWLTNREGEK